MNLKDELHRLTEKWRATGQKARLAAEEIPNLVARGHLHGMGDGLDVAATDVETLIEEPDLPPPSVVPSQDSK